jgi:hypothetical protein
MAKIVRADFWDVLDPQGRRFDLLPILQTGGGLPVPDRMRDRGADHIDYLADVTCAGTQASGTAARIRKHDWPERVHLQTGALSPLQLPPDEAIAEEMNFIFERHLQVLVTQRHGYFRASMLVDLLCDITRSTFDIQPKLREDAWQRFQRWTRIGSLDVKLRGPAHHPDLSRTIPSMGRFLDDASEEVNAWEVQVFFSMGRVKNRSLNRGLVRRIVNSFRGQENVKSLLARGRRAGGGNRRRL